MRSNGGDPLVEMSLVTGVTLVIGGVFAGYVNAVAGGGSAVTIPLFMWCGLDASMANGTNRVSVGIQAVSATASFRREGVGSVGHAVGPIVWTLIGAIGGALMVVQLDPSFLNVLFSMIFLVLAFVIGSGPGLLEVGAVKTPRNGLAAGVSYLAVGAYGGAFQAGVGVPLLLALVQLGRLDVVHANATKALVIAVYTVLILMVFHGVGQVAWQPGLLVGAGGILGSIVGARAVIKRGTTLVRWVVVIILSFSGVRGLWSAFISVQ
ncbi:MAG: sulfite exporter TauE/SafE family protein [Bradymonadia bacterium]